ncbi:MAG: PVC-type heme-binding CxxCH protein [Fuerstiella sp.]
MSAIFLFACLPTALADRQTALRQLEDSRTKYTTPETWAERRVELRQEFLKAVKISPLVARASVPAIVNELRTYKDYSVENVALETFPGFYCTGNLYRPVGRKDLGPVILCPHGHFRPLGRFRESQQVRCAHLARMGATVFSYSMVGYQDSTQTTHEDPLVLALQTWNSLRVVDFLTSLSRVDSTRVGVTGASGGGTQAMFLALIDDRVTAVAPAVIIYPWTEDQGCLCEGGLPIMKVAQTNAIELAAACAPTPQLLISVGTDSTKDFPTVGFPFMQQMYSLSGAKDAVTNVHLPEEAHDFGPSKRKAVYEFFAKHLRMTVNDFAAPEKAVVGNDQPIPEDLTRITIEPPERMRVFSPDHPRPSNALQGSESIDAAALSPLQGWQTVSDSSASRDLLRPGYSFKDAGPKDEQLIFTPPGFDKVGVPKVAQGFHTATLRLRILDADSGEPTHCRINVVGPDGNYYEPQDNDFKLHSLTGVWPVSGWGNRQGKAPVRYLGRFFYSDGTASVRVPAGTVRVEVWKGFEYQPVSLTTNVVDPSSSRSFPDPPREVTVRLSKTVPMDHHGYWSGDPHIHIQRLDDTDDDRILGLMQAEDIHYGSILAYNDPAGPYSGFMKRMDAPQIKGTGHRSTRSRGTYFIQSGQEYRSSSYGHLNLYLLDELVMNAQSNNADNWPPFGHVGQLARDAGGVSFYAHGGYAKEIYADVVQGNVDGVELLQFGVYRGIGLDHWYHMLNTGFRVPAMGACDYPACRKLGDCKTYVYCGEESPALTETGTPNAIQPPSFERWTRQMATGRSFFTNGPLMLFTVDGKHPGEQITVNSPDSGNGPVLSSEGRSTVKARVRVRCDVAPVTNVQIIGNGRILHEIEIPKGQGLRNWLNFEVPLRLDRSTWIAARAFSLSKNGTPDAEAHTNPVFVYFDDQAPYERRSLDVLVTAIDSQIAFHKKRKFAEQAKVIAYFEKSRDILMKIRENGGASATGHPSDVSVVQAMIDDPGKREHTDAELKEFLKPLPPKPISEALRSFETVGDFEMQLVAKEPLVNDPIAACFDENGNLYVCEMRDYPYKPAEGRKPIGTLRLLKDTNGDGTFDESHVFAEHLLWAGGVAPWKGGVYVAAAPDIWYLKDTDGDNKADVRRKVYTGFGTGNQQAMLNNLTWWLDHRIYGSTAGNGGEVRYEDSNLVGDSPISVSGRDFRFNPVDDRFESITGTVQFGNAFDDWGNRFLCSESRPLLHAVLPQRYLERNPFLPVTDALQHLTSGPVPCLRISPLERWRMIRSSRRIAIGARSANAAGASHHVIDAAAGVTVYRGGAYPSEYYGNIFIGGAQNNLIHRRTLSADGVTFSSARADQGTEFVRSSDNWFRPVNFINAPDGTLYVLDMSREILETIHVPLDVTKFVDFKSGRQHGRIYRLAPPGFRYPGPPSLGAASTAQLVQQLESPHGWYRDTAHRLLYEQQDPTAVDPLRRLLRDSNRPQAKLHAMWSLQGLNALADVDLLAAIVDPHVRVREIAVQLAEPLFDLSPSLLVGAVEAAKSADPRLRLQAAFSLGETDAPIAAKTLVQLAREIGSDRWMRAAVLSSSSRAAGSMFVELLHDANFIASPGSESFLSQVMTVIGSRNNPVQVDVAINALADCSVATQPLAQRLLPVLGKAMQSTGARLRESARPEAANFLRIAESEARSVANNAALPDSRRRSAIDFLSCWPLVKTKESLTGLISGNQTEAVQMAAVNALATYPDQAVGELFVIHWERLSPVVRQKTLNVLLSRTNWIPVLFSAIEQGRISVAMIGPSARDQLLNHRAKAIRSQAADVFESQQKTARADVVRGYESALSLPANVDAGQKLFQRDCASCHRLGNIGHALGPDLAASPSRDPQALLTHILDPNRYLLPRYETYVLVDTNGQSHSGMITAQTATTITLKQQENKTEVILRGTVDELLATGKSLMPEGFEKNITKQEMAGLISFLQSAKHSESTSGPLHIGTLPGLVEPDS